MPRIAATIGVIALIVFSVGFNISQYPIVWETSDSSSHLLPSVESLQAKTASDSAKLPPAEEPTRQYAAQKQAVRKPVTEQPRYGEPAPYEPVPYETVPYARYAPPEEPSYRSFESSEAAAEPDDHDTTYTVAVSSPQVAESSAKYGAHADSSATVVAVMPARPMVPVVTSKTTQPADDSAELSGSSPSGSSESGRLVRRLPSIEKVNAVPDDHQTVQLPMTPIPIYPATGF